MQKTEEFANKLKQLRTMKGISQQQLADMLVVSRSAISMWELGTRLPDVSMIIRLADCLGVENSVLLDIFHESQDLISIIVVEDVPLLLRGSIRLLQEELPEMSIIGFSNGQQALEFARVHTVSIAFLDVELDDYMDGLHLARKLTEINGQTNIIFLTSHTEYLQEAAYDHCSGYILKPLNRERIRHELNNLRYPVRGLNLLDRQQPSL
jgi:transcriptional regulator with XRE-family HTH domain